MQTFLPYPDYVRTARSLDRFRLGKQRGECLQIVKTLLEDKRTRGWVNHPAVKMWKGYELSLVEYGQDICDEWMSRGYEDTCADKMEALVRKHIPRETAESRTYEDPPWRGDTRLHVSHQSNLVRKDQDHYGPQFPGVSDDIPYFWPTKNGYVPKQERFPFQVVA